MKVAEEILKINEIFCHSPRQIICKRWCHSLLPSSRFYRRPSSYLITHNIISEAKIFIPRSVFAGSRRTAGLFGFADSCAYWKEIKLFALSLTLSHSGIDY
jgi:hypothetical protein